MIEEAWSIIGNHIIPTAHALWNEDLKDVVASHVSSYATDLMHYAWCRRKGKKKKPKKKKKKAKDNWRSLQKIDDGGQRNGRRRMSKHAWSWRLKRPYYFQRGREREREREREKKGWVDGNGELICIKWFAKRYYKEVVIEEKVEEEKFERKE